MKIIVATLLDLHNFLYTQCQTLPREKQAAASWKELQEPPTPLAYPGTCLFFKI